MTTVQNDRETDTVSEDAAEPATASSLDGPVEPATTATVRAGRGRRLVVFTALALAVALTGLDLTIVATALPTISGELRGLDDMSWIITAYLLAATVVLPFYGRVGNRLGRKGVFQVAVLAFLAGSLLASQAGTMTELVASRALQGVGAGGLMIGAQAILASLVPAVHRTRYLGAIGTVFGLATVAGPVLGGYLTDEHTWRWCFYLNLPVAGLALVVITLALRRAPRDPDAKLDLLGILVLGGLAGCAVFLAAWGGTRYAWDDPLVLGLIGGGIALVVVFLLIERLSSNPVIPLRLFRDPVFAVAGLLSAVLGFAMAATIAYLPLFLQLATGATPMDSGLVLLSVVSAIFLASVLAGRIISVTGHYQAFAILGTATTGAGLYLLSGLDAASSDVDSGTAMGVFGLGIGLVMPVAVRAVQAARPDDAAVATSASNYLRQVGAAVGVAAAGAMTVHTLDRELASVPAATPADGPEVAALTPEAMRELPNSRAEPLAQAFGDALPSVFGYGLVVLAAGFVLAWLLRQRRPQQPTETDPALTGADNPSGSPDATETRNGFISVNDTTNLAKPAATDETHGSADHRTPHIGRQRHPNSQTDMDTPADHEIRVFVRQDDGAPIMGAVLTLIDTAGNQVGRSLAAGEGHYRLPVPPPGSYVLIARADLHNPRARLIHVGDPPHEVEVVLGGESGMGGVVYAPDGSAVDGATVTLCDAQGSVIASRSTDTDGEYNFDDLLPGSYTLTVNAPALQPTALSVRVPQTGRIRQDVRLIGGCEVYGIARTRTDQHPIPQARVSLLDTNGHVLAVATTDSRGHYEFSNITEGEYTVVASCYPPVATNVAVHPGQAVEHDVELGYPDE